MDELEIDEKLTNSAFFTKPAEYHELFKALRAERPVHKTRGKAVRPYWSVSRYEDCKAILEDADLFSSRLGGNLPLTATEPTPEEYHRLGMDAQPTHIDPPRHNIIRQPLNRHFSAPVIARMRDSIQTAVDSIMEEVLPRGECDLVEEVCAPLPVIMVCEMMGVPREDWPKVRHYCAAFMGAQDPAYQIDGDRLKTQRVMMLSLFEYMLKLAMDRRREPKDDFTTLVGNMVADGQPLSEHQVGWWCFSLVAAGLETTRNTLSAGILGLIDNPQQADRLRNDPSLAPLAAEEIVRWVAPSKSKFRIATRDCEIAGTPIAAGDWIMAWLVSANRDETVFADPDMLDVGRSPNPHLGFGAGEHACLGRHLARLEMQLMLNAVLGSGPNNRVSRATGL
ncbi:MAG: cytochrome P450 [Sphingomonadaceae bacterium]